MSTLGLIRFWKPVRSERYRRRIKNEGMNKKKRNADLADLKG